MCCAPTIPLVVFLAATVVEAFKAAAIMFALVWGARIFMVLGAWVDSLQCLTVRPRLRQRAAHCCSQTRAQALVSSSVAADWECDYTVSFTSLRSLLGWYHAIESTRSKSISSPSLDLGVLLVTFAAVCASGSLLFDVIALGVKPSAFVSIASVGGESCLYLFVLSLSSLVNAHAGPGAVGAVIP